MKRITLLFFIAVMTSAIGATAQEGNTGNIEVIQDAIDACIALRDAAQTGDKSALQEAAANLRACDIAAFNTLRCKDNTITSLDGHLVFDEAFADSLANGRDVYRNAEEMSRSTAHRGQTSNGSILTKSCSVKAGKSTKYVFTSKDHQELAVVAEAGGLVTMKIHVTNSAGLDVWHNDTTDVKKGRPQRKTSFELPKNRSNIVELEVINCTKRDISFVIISN